MEDRKQIDKFVAEALVIEAEEAREAGALGYMARALTQATMPHKATDECVFQRKNGNFSLAMMAHPDTGLPYGSYPRLLLSWLSTEAVRIRSPSLVLGSTLARFMAKLGLVPTGGRWGTIPRLRDQMERLFSCAVSCRYAEENTRTAGIGHTVASEYDLWWSPRAPHQAGLWESTVTLSSDFFKEIINRPVPVDIRALKALKRSPMALDMYCWLTYRMSYLRKPTVIPWEALQMQFGSGYPSTPQGKRDFKKAFLNHLVKVWTVYPTARLNEADRGHGLLLKPSPPHIAPPHKF